MPAQAGDARTRQGGCRLVVYFLVMLGRIKIATFGRMLTMQNVVGGAGALLAEAIWHVALLANERSARATLDGHSQGGGPAE